MAEQSNQDAALAQILKTTVAGDSSSKVQWKKWTIADAGTIKDIADIAKELAEQIKTTSVLATTAMGVVKVIAELQSANIFLKALELLADEVIRALQDMKDILNKTKKLTEMYLVLLKERKNHWETYLEAEKKKEEENGD